MPTFEWLLWVFAAYGLVSLVWQVAVSARRQADSRVTSLTIRLRARQAESYIEGMVREIVSMFDNLVPTHVTVFGSQQEPEATSIMERLAVEYPCVRYVQEPPLSSRTSSGMSGYVAEGGAALSVVKSEEDLDVTLSFQVENSSEALQVMEFLQRLRHAL